MKSDSTTVIKNMEFLVKELHKEWDRSGASKASVIISIEEVDSINDKLKEIIYQTQKSVDEDSNYYVMNKLRVMFARISVSMLEPDLVIMDEFQRFKFLLSSDDSELGILAHSFLMIG